MRKMKVNFNNLRKQAIHSYDRLVKKLNSSIMKGEEITYVDGFGWVDAGTIIIESEDLQKDLDDLRSLIGLIAIVYEEGNDEFKDVFSELFPEGKEGGMQSFNPEIDE